HGPRGRLWAFRERRRGMNTRSLSFRLVAWYAGVLTLVFVLLAGLTFFFLRHYLEANVLDNQGRRAQQIAATLVAHSSRGAEDTLAAQVEDFYSPEANGRFIRITRADGKVVYVSGAPKDGGFDPSQVPAAPGTGDFVSRVSTGASGAPLLVAGRSV